MFIKVLGFLDVLAALIIFLHSHGVVSWKPLVFFALYLIIKGFIFFSDFVSKIDVLVGFLMFFLLIFRMETLSVAFMVYLLAKGIISMV
jgi:hypothetical protein